jgi:glycerol-3-phosphate dehydrogenase
MNMAVAAESVFDILIVGGGINGAGIACDAAGRGLSVFLCEQDDLAGATSSASSKLIHGGLRYLEHYEFRLVREALAEREVLLAKAPHIVSPLRFVLPHHEALRRATLIRLGLLLYDHLGGPSRLAKSHGIDLESHAAGAPLVEAMKKGFVYSDCWVDDARLVILNARAAADAGAAIHTRTRFLRAHREDGAWRARLLDRHTGIEREVRARVLVNAAGPWVREVMEGVLGNANGHGVRLVKGSHMVVPRLHDGNHAYILQGADRRVVFVLPYEGRFSLIGTTDVAVDDPASPGMNDDEARYLCDVINGYFAKSISPADAVWSYSGVRPLYDDNADNPSAVTRDYVLDLEGRADEAPLLSVFGGKITVYRRLAEHALEKLQPFLPSMGAPFTASAPLPGGDMPGGDFDSLVDALAAAYPGLERGWLGSLARRHGTVCKDILGAAATESDLGVHFGAGLYAREVDHLMANEWARTAEDVLWRRTKKGLHLDESGRLAVAKYISRRTLPSSASRMRAKETAMSASHLALPVRGVV